MIKMETTVLETRAITKRYKSKTALDGVSISLNNGGIYALVGNNGAGKSTLMRIISGLSNPSAGEIFLWGETGKKGLSVQRRRMGVLIEAPAFYPELSIDRNLCAQGFLKKKLSDGDISTLRDLVGLPRSSTGDPKAKQLSTGQKQRLGIAMALTGEPELLILDEPINGLDPEGVREMRELLLKLNKERGVTILLSSHILGEVYRLATDYIFLHRGRVLKTASAHEVAAEIESEGEGYDIEEYFISLVKEADR